MRQASRSRPNAFSITQDGLLAMPKSIAFTNLENTVLRVVMAIPAGKVVALSELALSLNVPARHVAYILSRQQLRLGDQLPLHRVIPAAGDFRASRQRRPALARQMTLLEHEGHTFKDNRFLTTTQETLHVLGNEHRQTNWADMPAQKDI
jgi:methylated-DNA-protein-cysteine methyltransferase-like protein